MKNSKRLFLILALVFFGVIGYLGYDISSRTTFPGSKPQLKERLIKNYGDTIQIDSLQNQTVQQE